MSKETFQIPTEEISQSGQNRTTPGLAEISDILARANEEELSLSETSRLISVMGSPDFEIIKGQVLEAANKIRRRTHGNLVVPMAPIEISNTCTSNCDFCGWRSGNRDMRRIRISPEIAFEQAKYFVDKGVHTIEYVGGDDPSMLRDDFMHDLVRRTKGLFSSPEEGRVQLCTMALTENQYRSLGEAGVDTMIVWQEAYDRGTYERFITSGPKATGIKDDWKLATDGDGYKFRLESQDRALRAGMGVALGTMIGLNTDINFEMLSTIAHANHLARNYDIDPKNPIIVGMPIWNKITTPATDKRPPEHVDVAPYFPYLAAIYFMSLPKKKAWIFPNCRVPIEMQTQALKAGGVLTSTEVKVGPGGYLPEMLRQEKNDARKATLIGLIRDQMGISFDGPDDLQHQIDEAEQFTHHHHSHEAYEAAFGASGLQISNRSYI